jgi:hypothetical protein
VFKNVKILKSKPENYFMMKKTILLFTLFISLLTLGAQAQKKGTITVNASYTGIVDGYDHINKTMVYVDGELAGETSEQVQSKPNSCSVSVPRGKHSIRIVNMAYYEGNWEEHTKVNEYSIDALYEGDIELKKKLTINLTFDIEKEQTFAKLK